MKNRNKIVSIKKDYIIVPKAIFKVNISSDALALYVYFCSLSEDFNPGIKAIRKALGCGRNAAYKYINELTAKKIIKISKLGDRGKRTLYEFNNPKNWILNNNIKKRAGRLKCATPDWVNKKDFFRLKADCPDGMVLDHIIPITHDNVSGLHVPWNIQYISNRDNIIKSNDFDGTYDNKGWMNKGYNKEPIIPKEWL